jgi:predicted nucleic-acid-binding protein
LKKDAHEGDNIVKEKNIKTIGKQATNKYSKRESIFSDIEIAANKATLISAKL